MIFLDEDLPPAALVDQGSLALAAGIAGLGGAWLRAEPASVAVEGGTAQEWRPQAGLAWATPAAAKARNCRLGPGGMVLEAGRNCGFVLESAVAEAACLTVAVLYHAPQGDIRTLASVAPKGSKAHLYLFDQDGALGVRDRAETVEVTLPSAGAGARLAVMGLSEGRLCLRRDSGATARVSLGSADLAGPADLFIGCRNHRESLVKTYGTGSIASVLLWPGLNLLDPESATGAAQLRALDAYRFWET